MRRNPGWPISGLARLPRPYPAARRLPADVRARVVRPSACQRPGILLVLVGVPSRGLLHVDGGRRRPPFARGPLAAGALLQPENGVGQRGSERDGETPSAMLPGHRRASPGDVCAAWARSTPFLSVLHVPRSLSFPSPRPRHRLLPRWLLLDRVGGPRAPRGLCAGHRGVPHLLPGPRQRFNDT